MKNTLLLLLLMVGGTTFAAKTVSLTVEWNFTNVIQGYDHDNKIFVYVDDVFVGESSVYKQTQKASYTVQVPTGNHKIRIEDYALYEGKWELHTKANQYSVDAIYENTFEFKSKASIKLVFDINSETSDVRYSGLKEATNKGDAKLEITWIYENVQQGYDHDNKMIVFVDGKKVGESGVYLESKKGKYVINVPKGSHKISIENYAFYEGEWELHVIENNYSVDAYFSDQVEIKKKLHKIDLVFDIAKETTTVKIDGKKKN